MGLDHYKQRTAELIAAGVPEEEAKKYAANEASDLRLQNTWMMATDVLQMNAIFGERLEDLEFLKRKFVFHPKIGRVMCPLDMRTLNSGLRFCDITKNVE